MCGQVAISRVALTSCDRNRRRGHQSSTQSKVSASLMRQLHAPAACACLPALGCQPH